MDGFSIEGTHVSYPCFVPKSRVEASLSSPAWRAQHPIFYYKYSKDKPKVKHELGVTFQRVFLHAPLIVHSKHHLLKWLAAGGNVLQEKRPSRLAPRVLVSG